MDKPKVNFECAPTMRTDRESWMGRTRDARKEDAIPGQSGWPPRTHRGRVVRPDTLGGKACWAYTSTVPVERSGIRAAHRGLDAPVRRHRFRRLNLYWSTPKIRVRVTTGGFILAWLKKLVAKMRSARKSLLNGQGTHRTAIRRAWDGTAWRRTCAPRLRGGRAAAPPRSSWPTHPLQVTER